MSGFRRGVRLGIDVGKARVGVARCDPDGLLATPVETVQRGDGTVARIVALVEEHSAVEVLVGLPLNMKGEDTAARVDAREFARALAAASDLPVRLVDERLSTVSAHAAPSSPSGCVSAISPRCSSSSTARSLPPALTSDTAYA